LNLNCFASESTRGSGATPIGCIFDASHGKLQQDHLKLIRQVVESTQVEASLLQEQLSVGYFSPRDATSTQVGDFASETTRGYFQLEEKI
jgi:hypothetical protein